MLHDALVIGMAENRLGGSITRDDLSFIPSLVNCTQLKYLLFGHNSLRGSLPRTIGNLSTQIIFISFEQNQIHGTIPSKISNLVNLNIFYMGDN